MAVPKPTRYDPNQRVEGKKGDMDLIPRARGPTGPEPLRPPEHMRGPLPVDSFRLHPVVSEGIRRLAVLRAQKHGSQNPEKDANVNETFYEILVEKGIILHREMKTWELE